MVIVTIKIIIDNRTIIIVIAVKVTTSKRPPIRQHKVKESRNRNNNKTPIIMTPKKLPISQTMSVVIIKEAIKIIKVIIEDKIVEIEIVAMATIAVAERTEAPMTKTTREAIKEETEVIKIDGAIDVETTEMRIFHRLLTTKRRKRAGLSANSQLLISQLRQLLKKITIINHINRTRTIGVVEVAVGAKITGNIIEIAVEAIIMEISSSRMLKISSMTLRPLLSSRIVETSESSMRIRALMSQIHKEEQEWLRTASIVAAEVVEAVAHEVAAEMKTAIQVEVAVEAVAAEATGAEVATATPMPTSQATLEAAMATTTVREEVVVAEAAEEAVVADPGLVTLMVGPRQVATTKRSRVAIRNVEVTVVTTTAVVVVIISAMVVTAAVDSIKRPPEATSSNVHRAMVGRPWSTRIKAKGVRARRPMQPLRRKTPRSISRPPT